MRAGSTEEKEVKQLIVSATVLQQTWTVDCHRMSSETWLSQ